MHDYSECVTGIFSLVIDDDVVRGGGGAAVLALAEQRQSQDIPMEDKPRR